MVLQLLANGLVTGCLYALVALGLGLIYNTTRVFHFAHGAVYTGAGYLCYVFLAPLALPLPAAVGLALLLTAALGGLMELVVYAPLARRGAPAAVALLSSLGLYVAVVNAIALVFGDETRLLRPGVRSLVQLGPVSLAEIQGVELITAVVLIAAVLAGLRVTPWGKDLRAVHDNPRLAEVMGLDLRRTRLLAFGLGSGLAGAAAVLSALDVGIDPQVGMAALLSAAVALIIGGLNTFAGPVVGGLVLGVLQSLVLWQVSARWAEAVTFGLLILTLLFRPQGLLGSRRRLEEAQA